MNEKFRDIILKQLSIHYEIPVAMLLGSTLNNNEALKDEREANKKINRIIQRKVEINNRCSKCRKAI